MNDLITILSVDDNEAHSYFVRRTLEHAGYRVTSVRDGKSAIEQAKDMPNLVLLDVHLPDMDGFEICRRLKADATTNRIPVIMYSGISQNGAAVNDARQLGASAFLFFPMAPDQLLMVVEGALKKASRKSTSK
jgi:CheY-like chemotaxis protein